MPFPLLWRTDTKPTALATPFQETGPRSFSVLDNVQELDDAWSSVSLESESAPSSDKATPATPPSQQACRPARSVQEARAKEKASALASEQPAALPAHAASRTSSATPPRSTAFAASAAFEPPSRLPQVWSAAQSAPCRAPAKPAKPDSAAHVVPSRIPRPPSGSSKAKPQPPRLSARLPIQLSIPHSTGASTPLVSSRCGSVPSPRSSASFAVLSVQLSDDSAGISGVMGRALNSPASGLKPELSSKSGLVKTFSSGIYASPRPQPSAAADPETPGTPDHILLPCAPTFLQAHPVVVTPPVIGKDAIGKDEQASVKRSKQPHAHCTEPGSPPAFVPVGDLRTGTAATEELVSAVSGATLPLAQVPRLPDSGIPSPEISSKLLTSHAYWTKDEVPMYESKSAEVEEEEDEGEETGEINFWMGSSCGSLLSEGSAPLDVMLDSVLQQNWYDADTLGTYAVSGET